MSRPRKVSFRFRVFHLTFVQKIFRMAIDTSNLETLIADFRALSQKDSVSPDSLGSLLLEISNYIKSGASQLQFSTLQNLVNAITAKINELENTDSITRSAIELLRSSVAQINSNLNDLNALATSIKSVPQVLVSIAQGSADRNDVLVDFKSSNLETGLGATLKDQVFIRQATTERAGVMRAQQVADLNSTRTGLAALQKSHTELSDQVTTIEADVSNNTTSIAELSEQVETIRSSMPKIYLFVENGVLKIFGHKYYIQNGYYPCVFRLSKKRNRRRVEGDERVKRCRVHKGWHVMGGATNVITIGGDNSVNFSTADHKNWHKEISNTAWSSEPIYLLGTDVQIPWGKSLVNTEADNEMHTLRMLRFRYAIGFTKKLAQSRYRVEPIDCDSNIAEFSVIFSPQMQLFTYYI